MSSINSLSSCHILAQYHCWSVFTAEGVRCFVMSKIHGWCLHLSEGYMCTYLRQINPLAMNLPMLWMIWNDFINQRTVSFQDKSGDTCFPPTFGKGTKTSHLEQCFGKGYVSSQEGSFPNANIACLGAFLDGQQAGTSWNSCYIYIWNVKSEWHSRYKYIYIHIAYIYIYYLHL